MEQKFHFNLSFAYDEYKKSMRYDNYDDNSSWLNTLFYHCRPGFGIAEWRDDYPLNGLKQKLFSNKDRQVFIKPIGWGEYASFGDIY